MAKAQAKPTDEEIAVVLCECKTQAEAAAKLNISVRNLYDRLQSFELQSILAAIRADQLRSRLQVLEDTQENAVKVIYNLMVDEENTPTERLKAAALILETGRAARAELAAAESAAVGRLRNAGKQEFDREGEKNALEARKRGETVFDFSVF